jgi:hypothetical protein
MGSAHDSKATSARAHLVVNDGIPKLQKRQTVEERRKDVQEEFAHDIRHVSVVPGKRPLEQLLGLSPSRRGVFASTVNVFGDGLALALLLHFFDLLREFFVLFAVFPDLRPVLVAIATNDIDGPFTV